MSTPSLTPTGSPRLLPSPRALTLLLGLVVAVSVTRPAAIQAQSAERATLTLTTKNPTAAQAFRTGLSELNNIMGAEANAQFKQALDADPSLGVARVLYTMTRQGLSAAEREAEMQRGLGDAAKGSSNELLVAMAYREMARNQRETAYNLFRAAAAAMPGEPALAFRRAMLVAAQPNRGPADQIAALSAVVRMYPEYAPARNTMAYALWRMGDHQGGYREAREYMRLLPTHSNSHDTYAELLQYDGRFDEAIAHYRKAMELNPTNPVYLEGIAESQLLMGRGDLARASIAEAAKLDRWPNDKGGHRRIASTYMIEGNAKGAMSALGQAVASVKAAGNAGLEAALHMQMASVDMRLGDGKAAAAHVAAGASVAPPNMAGQVRLMEAYVKRDWPAAHAAAESAIREMEASGNTNGAATVHELNALMYADEGRSAEAMAEIGRGDTGLDIGRMAMVVAAKARGDMGTAMSVSAEILGNRALALTNANGALARGVARSVMPTAKRK